MTKKLVTVALMFALSACMTTPGNKEQTIPALNIGKPQGGSYFDNWLQNSFDIPDALATQRYRHTTTTDEGQRDKWLATPITANSSRTANTSKVVEVKLEDIAAHFQRGELDVILYVGLPGEVFPGTPWSFVPFEQVSFSFVALDNLSISDVYKDTKAIAFLNFGEIGSLNQLGVVQLPNSAQFIPCNSLNSCSDMLLNGKVDALFSAEYDGRALQQVLSQQVARSSQNPGFQTLASLNYTLGALLNPSTLTSSEMERLSQRLTR